MRTQSLAAVAAACLLVLAVQACGDDGMPGAPSDTGTGGASAATISITANGVSPASVQVPVGSRVTFVNNDSRSHQMSSDPHPIHTECPAVNLAILAPGASGQTGVLNAARTCGFHDHLFPDDAPWRGTIVIQ